MRRVWFSSVRFQLEQICAVTDSVSEQQRSVRSISRANEVKCSTFLSQQN